MTIRKFVAFSGGVDSTALSLLFPEATPVFTDTGWEFPELYAHIERFERKTGRAIIRIRNEEYPGGIPEYAREHKFLPGVGARWCTVEFKIKPFNVFLRNYAPAELFIGLRADEENRVGNTGIAPDITIRYPLREMGLTRLDCVKICLEHDLLPRYPPYMARGGCIGCFYKRKTEVQAMIALVPEIVDKLQELEEDIQDRRGRFFHMFTALGCSLREARQQQYLFDIEDVYREAADRNHMGTACGLFCNR